jgi:bifunctional non-homologous end joining protein LigD
MNQLTTYRKKRTFSETPEPQGKEKTSKDSFRFVIQKHAASHLHYDFRLEMNGVLKSWAVPKGPSLNPEDKRLAMHVEDHPLSYRAFEGIIPEGNYGAGTVIVWDEGTYEPLAEDETEQKNPAKIAMHQYKKGNLKFILKGKKLKGEFALVKMQKEDKPWLLIKKNDRYATKTDVLKKDKSVLSKKTLEQVSKAKNVKKWVAGKEAREQRTKNKDEGGKKKEERNTKNEKLTTNNLNDLLKELKARKGPMLKSVKPMLTTLVDKPFNKENWFFEIKWDGYRAIAYINNSEVELKSRNQISFTEKFYPVTEELKTWNIKAILDGEIIAVNEEGKGEFQKLQSWQKTGEGTIAYYVFDILWLNGYNVTSLPLSQRKELLKKIIPKNKTIFFSDHIETQGEKFFKAAVENNLEGIIAKSAESEYLQGIRSNDWLKIKTHKRQEVVIAGYTEGRSSRKFFGALILGVYENKKLKYIGHTGTGFNESLLGIVWEKLQKLKTTKCPFEEIPKTNMPATWVKPKLVGEIKFHEWTKDDIVRQAVFLGLREDKKAGEVVKEVPKKVRS